MRPATPTATPSRVLTEQELAAEIGVTVSWLQHDRTTKRLLPFYRLGRLVRYDSTRVREALARMEECGAR